MTMTRDAIYEELTRAARDAIDRPGEVPMPEGPLAEEFDSLELMTLVVAIEDHFEIILTPDDELRITTLDDCVDIIAEKLAAQQEQA